MSSRRSVFRGLFALAAVGIAGADCRRLRASRERGPWLGIEPAADGEPEGVGAWRGLALAVRALPEERRAELVEEIAQWIADAEARHDPLVVDLIDDEPSPPLEHIRAWFLPIWNAATALDARRWRLPGRALDVVMAREGGRSNRGGPLFRAWEPAPETDSLVDRARFAAWPVTNARLVDAGTPAARARFASALGKCLSDPASCVGLFVDNTLLERHDRCPDFEAIRSLAERARRLVTRFNPSDLGPELSGLLEHLPQGEPLTTLKDWLDLGQSEVLVVPRLGALARRAAFDDELRRLRVGAGVPESSTEGGLAPTARSAGNAFAFGRSARSEPK